MPPQPPAFGKNAARALSICREEKIILKGINQNNLLILIVIIPKTLILVKGSRVNT